MKPEEKYFVIKGIREDFQWYSREEGYWLCEKHNHGVIKYRFYKEKKEADRECEKLRENYRKAIAYIEEGNEVWFVYFGLISVSKVVNITNIGYEMYYQMNNCEDDLPGDHLFKSKKALLNYLESNIQDLNKIDLNKMFG